MLGGGLRDFVTAAIALGAIPMIFRRPWIGIVIWSWLAYMNPHKLSYGWAHDFPFAKVTALVTLMAMLAYKGRKRIPWMRESVLVLLLAIWMSVTTAFAFFPDAAFETWDKVWKIMLFTFLTMMLINTRDKVIVLIWTIVVSLGLYGFKGGVFTLLTGGAYAVYGPVETFIGGNNEIGLALIMTVPWIRYIQLTDPRRWVRTGMVVLMLLTTVAILGTQSRGAFVGVLVMYMVMFLKNLRQIFFVIFAGVLFYGMVQFMPDTWHERMGTMKDYKADQSAMGRINAWWMAFHLANDHPVLGGGFETFQPQLFRIYAPDPNNVHDVHSIYFEMLGEQGYPGLIMYLLLGLFALLSARRIIRLSKGDPELNWAYHFGSMMQVSLVGYAVTGAFLGLSHFDLYYALIGLLVVVKDLFARGLAKAPPDPEIPHWVARLVLARPGVSPSASPVSPRRLRRVG